MTPLPLQPFIESVRHRAVLPELGQWTNLSALCAQAGVRQRATTPDRPVWIHVGSQQIRTPHADAVGVPVADLDSPEAALRALEALAHSFDDHAARACVCGRKFFTVPTKMPSPKARYWMTHDPAGWSDRCVAGLNQLLEDHMKSVTSSAWAERAKCSHDTALRDIQALVKAGLLVAGAKGGRSTRYALAE